MRELYREAANAFTVASTPHDQCRKRRRARRANRTAPHARMIRCSVSINATCVTRILLKSRQWKRRRRTLSDRRGACARSLRMALRWGSADRSRSRRSRQGLASLTASVSRLRTMPTSRRASSPTTDAAECTGTGGPASGIRRIPSSARSRRHARRATTRDEASHSGLTAVEAARHGSLAGRRYGVDDGLSEQVAALGARMDVTPAAWQRDS